MVRPSLSIQTDPRAGVLPVDVGIVVLCLLLQGERSSVVSPRHQNECLQFYMAYGYSLLQPCMLDKA